MYLYFVVIVQDKSGEHSDVKINFSELIYSWLYLDSKLISSLLFSLYNFV